jgi:eukaryotic-like serine/threonine-protein kinase
MTTGRESDLERICLSALERPAAERAAFISEACRGDEALRREAESLIAREGAAASFLEVPLAPSALSAALAVTVPTVAAGDRIGPYTIVSSLGSGGMGEVYVARDPTLGRDVAIKVLPSHFTSDPQRLGRFEREARLLASLNHPNIATIYGVEHAGGIYALVLELVEGETLAERLRSTTAQPPTRAGLPVVNVLSIARQIADALDAAHEKGIVHRDLKPANVMIRPDGVVKLLDFGLAKLMPLDRHGDVVDRVQRPDSGTVEGMTLGTPAYMSPEQARGLQVDKRTDIWAFGCIVFEMLAGRRPFNGNTVADTVAHVLEHEPDWSALPPTTPAALGKLVHRCLSKDPERRLRDIGDAVEDLEEAHGTDGVVHTRRPPTAGRPSRRLWIGSTAALIAGAFAAPWLSWLTRRATPARQPVMQLPLDLGSDVSLGDRRFGPAVAISPDDRHLTFVSNNRLMTQRLDHAVSVPLAGTEGVSASDGLTFFLSPDSRQVAFIADGKLKRIALDGGPVVPICEAPREGRGGTWAEDDSIVFAGIIGGLRRVRAAGGPIETLTQLEAPEITHRWPQFLPGGKAVLFTSHSAPTWWSRARVDVFSLVDGRRKRLLDGATFGRFVADSEGTGYLTFVRSGTLFAAAFDPVRLELLGPSFAVFEGVAYDNSGAAQMDASRTGSVIARRQPKFHVAWLDEAGSTPLFAEAGDYIGPMLSHAGDRVAFTAMQDVWVYDIRRRIPTQVTKGLAATGSKVWTLDDRFIVFNTPEGIRYVRADGGSEPRVLLPTEAPLARIASSITGDRHNSRLAFHQFRPAEGGKWDLWTVPIAVDGTGIRPGQPEPFLQTGDDERHLDFSPDGRWVAYSSSEEGGRHETFVRSFPDDGRRWKISDGGGMMPRFSPERPGLFFQAGEVLMVAQYSARGALFGPLQPRVWSRHRMATHLEGPVFAVSRDGTSVVAIVADRTSEEQSRRHVTLWIKAVTEFRRRSRQ